MRSEVKGEVPAVSRDRRTEPGHRESRGLPMPGEGSSLWREHERSIAPSRPVHYLDVREVKAPSRLKENLKSVGWAMPVAERLRSCPPDRDIPGPPPLLRCAAQPLP